MAAVVPSAESKAPEHIPETERLRLWVRSGGRCAICNEYLLEDQFTGYSLNLAEAAHIVARSTRGPRGREDLALDRRNEAENLMLLCLKHHTLIDRDRTSGFFPRENLVAIKSKHERRVRDLTGMVESQETTVIRVVGAVRNAPVVLSREEARDAVLRSAGKYPRFDLSVEGDLEIDLRGVPDPGSADYWRVGARSVDVGISRLRDAVERKAVRHVSVFGFARIPLLVHLGYMISDKLPTDVYQRHRESANWVWSNTAPPVTFATTVVRDGTTANGVALILSLSGTVRDSELPTSLGGVKVYTMRPVEEQPHPNLVRTQETLRNFELSYRSFLAHLEEEHKGTSHIHLFPAIPLAAALTCGYALMREIHPALVVHDRVEGAFTETLTVNRRS